MKTIKHNGKLFQVVSVNEFHFGHKFTAFRKTETDHLQFLTMTLWQDGPQIDVSSTIFLPDVEKVVEAAEYHSACPKCGVVHELLPVDFKAIKYSDLCKECLNAEMEYNGIAECCDCGKVTELLEVREFIRTRDAACVCEDCLGSRMDEWRGVTA